MEKSVIALFALAVFAGTAFAADVMELKRGVTFPHTMHKKILKGCRSCHDQEPGRIEGFGKEWAHKVCKGCHVVEQAGPTLCKDCHK